MLTDWFEVQDPRFRALVLPNVHVETLFSGGRWLEGPVYVPAGRYLLFSDIPNNRVMRWDETDNAVSTFQSPSNFANGHSLDGQGRVLACEHLSRAVTRVEHDGTVSLLADRFEGKRLNSPNDVVVADDGAVWFTDPSYGISTEYEGSRSPSETGTRNVYRIGAGGDVVAVLRDLVQPNGLAFSPDQRVLYVVDSGSEPARLYGFDVLEGKSLANRRLVSECQAGIYDGIRIDRQGNIWAGTGEGIHCLAPDGTLLGKILLPETTANLCFGGRHKNRLFMCATRSLFAVYVNVTGV